MLQRKQASFPQHAASTNPVEPGSGTAAWGLEQFLVLEDDVMLAEAPAKARRRFQVRCPAHAMHVTAFERAVLLSAPHLNLV
eukprot:1816322-Rhodomonas_salina.3